MKRAAAGLRSDSLTILILTILVYFQSFYAAKLELQMKRIDRDVSSTGNLLTLYACMDP